MSYILIMMASYMGHGVAVSTVEFNSQAKCIAAGNAFQARSTWCICAQYICALK